jgi:hypothetical protein
MVTGLYKIEFETSMNRGVGVLYADNGRLHGGSSAFAYVGHYAQNGASVRGVISSIRHTADADLPAVFGFDNVHIAFNGETTDDVVICEGVAEEAPSVKFKALLTRVSD